MKQMRGKESEDRDLEGKVDLGEEVRGLLWQQGQQRR